MSTKDENSTEVQHDAKLPVMDSGNERFSFEQLKDKERWLENEIEALQHSLSNVQTEIFYRVNPECRVSHCP